MKITDRIIDITVSSILKRGILYEAKNIDVEIPIPQKQIKINIKCENMTLRIEKDAKTEA